MEIVKIMFMGLSVMLVLNYYYVEPAEHYIEFIEV